MSRRDAEQSAVAKLGDPGHLARGFSRPTTRDWIIDATAWWSTRVAGLLLGLGALMVRPSPGPSAPARSPCRRCETPRLLNVVAELSLAALGVTLLVGGSARSALDGSWHWVPVWLPVGLACLGAALLFQ